MVIKYIRHIFIHAAMIPALYGSACLQNFLTAAAFHYCIRGLVKTFLVIHFLF